MRSRRGVKHKINVFVLVFKKNIYSNEVVKHNRAHRFLFHTFRRINRNGGMKHLMLMERNSAC